MKQLERLDAKTRIKKFLSGEDDILLTSEEEKILARWEFANDLMIKKEKTWEEMRELISLRFVVSKFTAEKDICNAQDVFGISRKVSKRYLLHLHLDRIDRDIEMFRNQIFWVTDEKSSKKEQICPGPKDMAALARMAEAYTYTLNSIPEDIDRSKLPPPIYVFKLPPGVVINQPMSLADAMKQADEYIDFEILNNGTTNDTQSPGSTGQGKGDAPSAHADPDSEAE